MYRILSMENVGNRDVTSFYMDIIREGLGHTRHGSDYFSPSSLPSRHDTVVLPTVIEALRYYLKGYRDFGVWLQGILPEESYLKHQSALRRLALELIEIFILRKSKFLFAVSPEMVRHYSSKYRVDFQDRVFVMPCFNAQLSDLSFSNPERYQKKIFTYVGSLEKWQCFDEMLKIYSKLESLIPECELRIYTKSITEAKEKASECVKNFTVEYYPDRQLQQVLQQATYGFIVRDDSPINQVATPTKISSYMANGVLPIFSDSLKDFTRMSANLSYAFPLATDLSNFDELVGFCSKTINHAALVKEFTWLFSEYYCRNKYICEIASKFDKIITQRARS